LENIVSSSAKNTSNPLHNEQQKSPSPKVKADFPLVETEKDEMDIEPPLTLTVPEKMEVVVEENEPTDIVISTPINSKDNGNLTSKPEMGFNQFLMRLNANVKDKYSLAMSPPVDWNNTDRYYLYLCLKHFPLFSVMQEATKVLTTKDWILAREEMEVVKAMEMIERLKDENRWSCRQRKKFQMPLRQKTRWDLVLEESVCII
jgi:hypothetical protein